LNAEDRKRDAILRFLYERHRTTRGIQKIPIGIRDLQREMKSKFGMNQAEVASNLDYLVQVNWVKEVVKERSFKTSKGMEVSQEQIKYKISDTGINHLQSGTLFRKPETSSHVNITNIQGVTIIGDGNIVNAEFTDLSRALSELDNAIAESPELSDIQKLDAAGDLSTIRTQIAKKNPNPTIIKAAWDSLQSIATIYTITEVATKVGGLIAGLIR
jgi:hypothetical protein